MLNTKKLLIILPDVAYSAELLPGKKPLRFSIQSCIQVNGTFIEDQTFNVANLSKLFSKLATDEAYQVILPDDLFVNAIVTIDETGDAKIKEELKATILPSLSLNQETHDIVTTVLNELRGASRVQLSAIEKDILSPLRAAATNAKVQLEHIAPLSWVLKSIVSLEPSVVVLQLGSMLYGSFHYIGVEKCFAAPTDQLTTIIEKVQLLKKEEPSIMTCYLITNALVESELKEGLQQLLPIQQMTEQSKDQEKLPAMVATIIEEAARTLAISDFPVPQFNLGTASDTEVEQYAAAFASATASTIQGDAMPKASSDAAKAEKKEDTDLPKPKVVPTVAAVDDTDAEDKLEDSSTEVTATSDAAEESTKAADKQTAVNDQPETAQPTPAKTATDTPSPVIIGAAGVASTVTPASAASVTPVVQSSTVTTTSTSAPTSTTAEKDAAVPASAHETVSVVSAAPVAGAAADSAIDLRQFAGAQSGTIGITSAAGPTTPVAAAGPIKNTSRSMTKMVVTALIVFIGTVAIGVGVGVLVLRYTSTPAVAPPVVEVQTPQETPEPTPDTATDSAATNSGTPSASPAATSSATLSPAIAAQKVLVANATDKAGYAGQIRDSLTKAGFKSVTAANAKGTYTATGDLIFQKTANEAALTALESASGLSLTSDDAAKQEDPQGSYDVVIVLNQ